MKYEGYGYACDTACRMQQQTVLAFPGLLGPTLFLSGLHACTVGAHHVVTVDLS